MKYQKSNIKNFWVIATLSLGVLMLIGIFWTGRTTVQAVGPNQSIVDKLVERFNLNKEEVTGVFNQVQQERQQKMQEQMESRLEEAVKDGVITSQQKEAFLKKQAEMWEKQKQLQEEWKKWMEESGIDFEKLAPYRVGCGGPGFGGFGGKGFGGRHQFGGF